MALQRYIIERDIPQVGALKPQELAGAAGKSNAALNELAPKVQWLESFVAADKTFCVYLADSEEAIRKHSELSGIPVTAITEVPQVIDH